MTADLPDPVTDPASYVLAVADLREQRVKAATPGRWQVKNLGDVQVQVIVYDGEEPNPLRSWTVVTEGCCADTDHADTYLLAADAEHIAAEANPGHALAEVTLWCGIVDRHHRAHQRPMFPQDEWSPLCAMDGNDWPCDDLLAVVAAATAYAGGAP